LQSVLNFYDEFARQNARNPKLEEEAARAYGKVAALHRRLGRLVDSEKANSRAISIYEDLIARFPEVRENRSRLVDVYVRAEPAVYTPESAEARVKQLQRALDILDDITASETQARATLLPNRVLAETRLAAAQQRLRQSNVAEASYRRALALYDELVGSTVLSGRSRYELAELKETFAAFLIDHGRPDEARAVLTGALEDTDKMARTETGWPLPLFDRYTALAESYRRLGDSAQAEALDRKAEEFAMRGPQPPGPGRQRGPGRPEDHMH
jgi:tetratricopeptide (TPR) repeat protein